MHCALKNIKMEDNNLSKRKRKTIVAVVSVVAVCAIIFLFLFSLFHLPERDPIETPELAENPNYVESPAGDFEETNDVMSAPQEQLSEMIGQLEMQYENASLNGEPYAAQQAGLRLALAYRRAGENQKATELVNKLIESYSFDTSFVEKCREFLNSSDTEK